MDDWNYIKKKSFKQNKIKEPCWFYNTTGCKNKDGSEKSDSDCKYMHVHVANVKKPLHINQKPCSKYNIDGFCKWKDSCLYSHKDLDMNEWSSQFPNIPHIVKASIGIHKVVADLEASLEKQNTEINSLKNQARQLENDLVYYTRETDMVKNQIEWMLKRNKL